MSKKPKKIPFENVPVDVWSPLTEGQPYIAMFRGLPMIFKGIVATQALNNACDWRTEEMAKEARKKSNAKAAGERLRKYREART